MGRPKITRRTIGENPLDVLIASPAKKAPATPPPSTNGKAPTTSGETTRATFYLPIELLEDARNVVVALSGPPVRLTLTKLAENAFRAEVERLKRKHNDGKTFPQRDEDPRVGRPIGAKTRKRATSR